MHEGWPISKVTGWEWVIIYDRVKFAWVMIVRHSSLSFLLVGYSI